MFTWPVLLTAVVQLQHPLLPPQISMEPYAPWNIAKIHARLCLHPCFPPVQHEKFEVGSYHIKGERKLIKGQSALV